MKNTGIKVTEVSIETMLNDEKNAAYNPTTWKDSVNRFAGFENIKFYIAPKNDVYSYDRFFVSYTIPEGLNIFSEWSAFHSSMSNNSFRKTCLINDEICVIGFGKDQGVINSREGRKWLRENVCAFGVLVTNCF